MVTAAAAIVNKPIRDANPSRTPTGGYIKNILWASATIAPSKNGEYLGHRLSDPSLSRGNAFMRELNMENAIVIAKAQGKQPIVRVANVAYSGQAKKDGSWTSPFAYLLVSSDGIYDLNLDGLTSNHRIYFRSREYLADGETPSHQYQIYKDGQLVYENLGGSAERRKAWPAPYDQRSLYGTFAEPSPNPTYDLIGNFGYIDWPAIN